MEQPNINPEIPFIRIEPNFDALRSINYNSTSDADFETYIKQYKQNNCVIELYFMTTDMASEMLMNIKKVLIKYGLAEHEENIGYLLIENYRQTYIEATEARIPNGNNPKRTISFAGMVDFLLAHPEKQFKVSFTEILNEDTIASNNRMKKSLSNKPSSGLNLTKTLKKPIRYTCKDEFISRWLIDAIIKAVEEGKINLQMGYQLVNSEIVENAHRKRKELKLKAPEQAFEDASEKTIWADAVASVCFPILNYLKLATILKDDSVQKWSAQQLKCLVELMIAIGYLTSSKNKPFEFGTSEPTLIDIRRLAATLDYRLNQRKP